MLKENVRQYLVAGGTAAGIVGMLAGYLALRRGYFDLSILNKSLGSGSLILLGVVLLLGPLSRLYDKFDKWINYRKELGVLAFFTGGLHIYLSMFPLARRGPFGLYQAKPLIAYSGLLGFLLMLVLFILSFEKIKNKIDAGKWWLTQNIGVRIAAVAVLLHMTLFKYADWIKFLAGEREKLAMPNWPPASLLVAIFSGFVLLVRLSEFLGRRSARLAAPVCLVIAVGFTSWLFWQ